MRYRLRTQISLGMWHTSLVVDRLQGFSDDMRTLGNEPPRINTKGNCINGQREQRNENSKK